jgi:exosortase/archaeosortase family protein
MKPKKIYQMIFLLLAVLLVFLPFLLTFNDVLTRFFLHFQLYVWLQKSVVPLEVKVVGLVVRCFGVDYLSLPDGMMANGVKIRMSWNCLGWQSLVLFLVSLVFGFKNSAYTLGSKIEAVFIGLVGLFWINIFRISLTVILAAYFMNAFRIVFHDYLAAIVTILYLFAFWWFAFRFVLEEK